MAHNILVVDNKLNVISIRNPSDQELQAIMDTEDFVIIDPLNHQVLDDTLTWNPINTGMIMQDKGVITIR